ncbi:hypothetical protein D3C83_247430 [compost metagenome]
MRACGQPDHAAEAAHRLDDPRVVGGDDDRVDPAHAGGAAVDVLDHRTSADVREWLAGKSRRGVAGGNDGDDVERL